MNPAPTKLEIAPGIEMMGRLIGKYRVVRELGRGGMGAVFEAVHEEVGQRLAVKVMHARLASDQKAVGRFFDEAKAVSRVDHPGLVKLFDFNQMPDGTIYIMMELLKGEPLQQRIERLREAGTPLQRGEALFFIRQIASTLAAVHAEGIVHRDLKPDNVILVPDPDSPLGERVKLVDFGIAKFHEMPEGDRRTTEGAVLGTPIYMSPEQCRGAQRIDERTDVYSLGVMLYEMLAGFPPFDDEGAGGIIAKHIYVAPRPLREVDATITPELAQLAHDMLSKDAAARPSMQEVIGRIDVMDGVVRSRTGSLTHVPAVAPPQRPPILWIGGAALVAAAVVGVTVALLVRRPEPPRSAPPAQAQISPAPPTQAPPAERPAAAQAEPRQDDIKPVAADARPAAEEPKPPERRPQPAPGKKIRPPGPAPRRPPVVGGDDEIRKKPDVVE